MIHMKLPRRLHDSMMTDLMRSHLFAYERVGFLFVKKGTISPSNFLLIAAEYQAIPDTFYIEDPNVGAKINSAAIRSAMERAMTFGYGIIHTHLHDEKYSSLFSRTDESEFMKLIPSFHNIGGDASHGAVVFSGNRFTGFVLTGKHEQPNEIARVSVIDYPITEYLQERSRSWKTTGIVGKAF